MNKRTKLGFIIKAIATAVAVVVLILSGFNSVAASVWKMTYPCQVMFYLNILSLLPVIAIVMLATLPLKCKIGLNVHLFNEVCILIGLIINGIAFAFDFRAEYTMLYGLFSEQMEKALMVVFYAMLFVFHKTGKFRNFVIAIGAFLCGFKLVYNYLDDLIHVHQNLSLSVISSVLVVATLVMILCVFSDLDRYSYFCTSKQYPFPHYIVYAFRSKEEEYSILRVTERSLCLYNLITGESKYLGLYNKTGLDSQEAENKVSEFKNQFDNQLKNSGERLL